MAADAPRAALSAALRGPWIVAGLFACLLLALLSPAGARERYGPQAADVEAAYLVNFLRYTQWPAPRFASPDAPLVVTVVGSPEVAQRVRSVAAAAGRVDGRPIEVRNLPSPRGSHDTPLDSAQDREAARLLGSSHLVYFHESAATVHPRVFSDLWGQPVLTVGNARGFTARGGMLGLVRVGGNIVFEANPGAIRGSGLVVSAKVLKLARMAR